MHVVSRVPVKPKPLTPTPTLRLGVPMDIQLVLLARANAVQAGRELLDAARTLGHSFGFFVHGSLSSLLLVLPLPITFIIIIIIITIAIVIAVRLVLTSQNSVVRVTIVWAVY